MGTEFEDKPWFERGDSLSSWVPPDKQDKPFKPDETLNRQWDKLKDLPRPKEKDKDKA